jgi:DNA helicase-2/ATP-dependent DNA helicase PcrA
MLKLLERDGSTGVAARVRTLAEEAGMLYSVPDKLGERELTRQTDLARLVRLAAELEEAAGGSGGLTRAGFAAELRRRYDPGSREVHGVHLLTYHRAKGLEFDAVFLPRLDEKELPTRLARTDEEREEERRLLYVGITRARRFLAVTWSRDPSPFLAELGVETRVVRPRAAAVAVEVEDPALFDALAAWRKQRAHADAVPAYVVFHNTTLAAIAGAKPRSIHELARVPGIGPAKLDRYGEEVLAVVGQAV